MTGLRAPVVAGVAGGVGTTTLAVALRARDAGRERVDTADVVACRGTLDSLARAADIVERAGPGPRPVLAVTLDGARARGAVRARLELLGSGTGAVVLLPHVERWRTLTDPVAEVATLLRQSVDRLPRPLRAYAAAVRELAGAVTTSGRLHPPPHSAVGPDVPRIVSAFERAVGNAAPPVPEVLQPDPEPARQRGVRIVLPAQQAEQAG